jgi:hypothetical protein
MSRIHDGGELFAFALGQFNVQLVSETGALLGSLKISGTASASCTSTTSWNMTIVQKAIFACVFLLAAARGAHAQAESVPAIDPSISQLVSGGYWESGARRGTYRVVELASGWEHIRRRVVVQWLLEPSSPEASSRVVATVPLEKFAEEVYSVSEPVLDFARGWNLTVRTTSRPDQQPDGTLRFKLGAPNKVQLIDHK